MSGLEAISFIDSLVLPPSLSAGDSAGPTPVMRFVQIVDWLGAALAVVGVLWTLVKSVHVRVNVRVRKLDQPPVNEREPNFTFQSQMKVEHGRPIRFGTRTTPPA